MITLDCKDYLASLPRDHFVKKNEKVLFYLEIIIIAIAIGILIVGAIAQSPSPNFPITPATGNILMVSGGVILGVVVISELSAGYVVYRKEAEIAQQALDNVRRVIS